MTVYIDIYTLQLCKNGVVTTGQEARGDALGFDIRFSGIPKEAGCSLLKHTASIHGKVEGHGGGRIPDQGCR